MSEMPHGRTFDMDFMFTKLIVADLAKSAAFYTAAFGLIKMHRLDAEILGRAVSELVFQSTYAGGPMLILAQFHDAKQAAANELILGFATQDMEACLARVEQAGGTLAEPVREISEANMRVAFLKDPEGHIVQVTQIKR